MVLRRAVGSDASRVRGGRPRSVLVLLALAVLLGAGVAVPAQAAPCTQTDPIARKYCELGAAASVVGTPVGAPYAAGAGRAQDYTRGTIAWSPATAAHEVHGSIWTRYRAAGGPGGFLGFPLTDELLTPDLVGRFNHFQGGSIYWSAATGAHEVHGAIRTKWQALGWEAGLLGYPLTDELLTPDLVGRFTQFQG